MSRSRVAALAVGALVVGGVAIRVSAQTEPADDRIRSCDSVSPRFELCYVVDAVTTTTEVEPSTSTTDATTTTASSVTPTSTTSPTSTTTTVPPTSSTVAPSTTSSVPSTTTTNPTTTIPTGGGFTENFATAAGFFDRFDYGMSGWHPSVGPGYTEHWEGDHSMGCQGANTSRVVNLGTDRDDLDELFWHCAPGGPDTGHVMTSLVAAGYVYLWFSPAQYFTDVKSVCWDQNQTFMGGRKWTQVSVSTRAEVERVQAEKGYLDLGFSHPGFQVIGGPTTEVIPTDETVAVGMNNGQMGLWQGDHEIGHNRSWPEWYLTEDVATRFRHCMIDNGDGTITLTEELGDYTGDKSGPEDLVGKWSESATLPGSLPDGEVRVAFVDANYNPEKDASYDPGQNTWHFDQIEIEVE